MKIDYKKELEQASKGMIMIHDPKLLIKLIVRTIVRKLSVKHAAMILYEPQKDAYILDISRGETGVKIPARFARFDAKSPLIALFTKKEFKPLTVDRSAIVADDISRMIWRETVIENGSGREIKELLHQVEEQMLTLNTVACVPAYYQDKLLAILLLGEKYNGEKFDQEELDFFAAIASDTAMAIRNAQLFSDVKKEAERNRQLFLQTIIVLGSTIEAKDAYTHGHTERVTKYALAIARQMNASGTANFEQAFFDNLYIAGMLHDIGKIGVKEAILNKKGKLNDIEFAIMRQHTVRGAEMIKPLSLSQVCVDGVKYHHENYDGSGYPEGLKGEDIPLSAAIIAVADTFDAMSTDRPYRKGLKKEKAVEHIKNLVYNRFHPLPAQALVELWEAGKI